MGFAPRDWQVSRQMGGEDLVHSTVQHELRDNEGDQEEQSAQDIVVGIAADNGGQPVAYDLAGAGGCQGSAQTQSANSQQDHIQGNGIQKASRLISLICAKNAAWKRRRSEAVPAG